MTDHKKLGRQFLKIRKGPCLFCGRRIDRQGPGEFTLGIFIPDNPEQFIAAAPRANAMRSVMYGVCVTCSAGLIPAHITEMAEKLIMESQCKNPVIDCRTNGGKV